MSISVLNTDAGLSGKTIVNLEDSQTVTGAKTFDRDPNAPFVVTASSAKVDNLDADKLDGLEGSAFAEIANTETISAVWTFSAKPSINAGLQFPASQASSADANTLDDYEEGSWTPTIGGSGGQSGQAYTTQAGRYIKVGKLVMCWGRIVLSTLGTVTASVQIQGLPFTSDNVSNLWGDCHINWWTALTSSYVYLAGQINANDTKVTLIGATAAATGLTTLVQADLSNTSDFIFCIKFQASA